MTDDTPKVLIEGEDFDLVPTGQRNAETDAPILGRKLRDPRQYAGTSSESTRGGFLRRLLPWAR